jgi:hypothetical protein
MDQYGTWSPVAYLLHKYENKEVIREFFDSYALWLTDSPRHDSWPVPARLASSRGAPASPRVGAAIMASAGVSSAAAAALCTSPDVAAAPPALAAAGGGGGILQSSKGPLQDAPAGRPFCPAYVIIDVSQGETAAAEESLWARGFQGFGLEHAKHWLRVVWCSWHSDQAWERKLFEPGVCDNPVLRRRVKEGLKLLRDEAVAVRAINDFFSTQLVGSEFAADFYLAHADTGARASSRHPGHLLHAVR